MTSKEKGKGKKGIDLWTEGYQRGFQAAMRENDIAIKIGRAILEALDNRYEFKKEDY